MTDQSFRTSSDDKYPSSKRISFMIAVFCIFISLGVRSLKLAFLRNENRDRALLFALLQDRPGDREGTGCGKRASLLCGGFDAGLVAPFDQREIEGLQRDLDSRDAAGMDAGAAVVINGLGLALAADAPRGGAGFQVSPLREREVLEDGAVGVAGDDDFVLFLRHPG